MLQKAKAYMRTVGARGVLLAVVGRAASKSIQIQMTWPDVAHPFFLRIPLADVGVCRKVFQCKEYDFEVVRPPEVIVDAGANIGLASIYFANKFPHAKIVAIEPERSNYELLARNVAPYPNVKAVCGALWNEDARINLVDPGLGESGFQVKVGDASAGGNGQTVRAMTVDTIMQEHGFDRIDILKVDIEGSEKEVFADPSAWINRVGAVIVELHEWLRPGCSRSFYSGTSSFDAEWMKGENVFVIRKDGCIATPGGRHSQIT